MKEFKDRVAVVTGGASGIGRAMAERFAAAGTKVVLADVEEGALIKAAREMREKGATVLGILTDVAKAEQVEALCRKTLETFGAVHVLCNNAGVAGDFGTAWSQARETWEWVLGVNLWGVIHGIRTFVPIMLKQNTEGHIVNTASGAGLVSFPLMSVYDVTKHAVVTLSESLHHELSLQNAKVKVSVLCPGFVNTNIIASERNRPAHLRTPNQQPSELEQAWLDAFREWGAAGMAPAEVAARVFNAIRDEQFYIFPQPEILESVRARMETILKQGNPTLDLPDEMKRRLHL
ncbi:MAG TPA: SDR family NAD(P)-dependent oxidoreductase [Candidatus Binatia bacterium]|jgi:NAD(P)-dependent dehydrogenase (short-subunit alcohol dehydrogenase family)|nr:SDR family NAD(P)-dependent oxidoreductase [Candidatus Binatia bacterium]